MRKEAKIEDSVKGFHWWLRTLLLLLSACVTDYESKGLEQIQDLLVVDSIITNGEITTKLRGSMGLADDFTKDKFMNNARAVVECEDGTAFTCANSSREGEYKVDMGELDPGGQYRLHISLDGLRYESDYLGPEIMPPTGSLSLLKKGLGEEVRPCVSTHNAPDRSSYFRWIYKKNWKVKAEIFMAAEKVSNAIIMYDLPTSNNWHYCWGKDNSKVISLGSFDRLTQNVIANKSIASYHPSNRRFSILYYTKVEQYVLHRGAYDYYSNLQKNIEGSGSLFAPIPLGMRRNIHCMTDLEVPVIGFVEVVTVTHLRRFFPEIERVYEARIMGCASAIIQGSEYDNNLDCGCVPYNPMSVGNNAYVLKHCTNRDHFGSKQKPSW